jgi:hypothetical protein
MTPRMKIATSEATTTRRASSPAIVSQRARGPNGKDKAGSHGLLVAQPDVSARMMCHSGHAASSAATPQTASQVIARRIINRTVGIVAFSIDL